VELVSARRDVALVMAEHGLAERYACRLLEVDRSTYRYEPRPDRNAKLREALLLLANQHPRYGYRRLWALLIRRGWQVDVKRVHRLYKAEGLMVRRLKRKRLITAVALNPLLVRPNQEWAMDFVSDALTTGRALRTFTLIDSYTKESLAIEVNTGISSRQVTRVLERVIAERGVPGAIRCDNGPEFTSLYFIEWCKDHGVSVIHIQPGKPVQNSDVESFNGRFRDECLNSNLFVNLNDARKKIEAWAERIQRRETAQQSGLSDATGVRKHLLRTHQQDGRHPTGPSVGRSGSHAGARRQGFANAVP
jgi:putative transposase